MYYVYIYLDPRKPKFDNNEITFEHEPFYVGKGKGRRAWKHLERNKRDNNLLKINKIKRICDAGYIPKIIFLATDIDEESALLLEKETIRKIGTKWNIDNIKRGPLTNQTSGGDGKSICSEVRKKYGLKGDKNPMYGKTHTEEAKEKIRQQSLKLKHSAETKSKMSEARSNGNNYNILSWNVLYPDGNIHVVHDLSGLAKEIGVHYQSLAGSQHRVNPISRGPAKGFKVIGKH